ncbi:unnamed protein product, partial [marine sediment metagenome]
RGFDRSRIIVVKSERNQLFRFFDNSSIIVDFSLGLKVTRFQADSRLSSKLYFEDILKYYYE